MTAPYHQQKLANRELGTVDKIDGDGNLKLHMDSGREVEFNARQHRHLDYGYAVTSHSGQGQTADRVLIHIDSEQAYSQLLNSRMAYVSVSHAPNTMCRCIRMMRRHLDRNSAGMVQNLRRLRIGQ